MTDFGPHAKFQYMPMLSVFPQKNSLGRARSQAIVYKHFFKKWQMFVAFFKKKFSSLS